MKLFACFAAFLFVCYVCFSLRKIRSDSDLSQCITVLAQSDSAAAQKAVSHIRLFVLDYTHQRHHKLSKRRSKIRTYLSRASVEDSTLFDTSRTLSTILATY